MKTIIIICLFQIQCLLLNNEPPMLKNSLRFLMAALFGHFPHNDKNNSSFSRKFVGKKKSQGSLQSKVVLLTIIMTSFLTVWKRFLLYDTH